MKRLTYENANLTRRVAAYVGVHAWLTNNVLAFASILGPESSVRGLIAAIQNGERLRCEGLGEKGWGTHNHYLQLSGEKKAFRGVVRLVDTEAKQDGLAHGLVMHRAAFDHSVDWALLLNMGESGQTLSEEEAFWRLWQARWPVPGLREWSGPVWQEVRRWYAAELPIYQRPGQGIAAYRIEMTEDQLEEIISQGLASGRLQMPDGPSLEGGVGLQGVTDVTTYLTGNSKALAGQISSRFQPLYRPGESERDKRLDNLVVPLYRVQEDVAQGVALAVGRYGAGVVCGEMGCGKTRIGAVAPYLIHRGGAYRWFVMVPPHLVDKWVDEVKAVIPGADAVVIETISELEQLVKERPRKPARPEYIILSRERAKLDSPRRPAVLYGHRPVPGGGRRKDEWEFGPLCADCGLMQTDDEGAALDLEAYVSERSHNRRCRHCGAILWGVGSPSGNAGKALRRPFGWQECDARPLRRAALAEYIKRRLKGWAQGLILDEVHELKGATAQGNAMGALAAAVRSVLAMTGTLSGGYAHDLYRLLYRLRPALLKARGFEYGGIGRWAQVYGRIERVTKTTEGSDDDPRNTTSRGSKKRSYIRVRPGISPRLFGEFLMPFTAFLELQDLGHALPEYREEVELVRMEPDLAAAYEKFRETLKAAVEQALYNGSRRLLGAYLQALLNFPDKPWENPPVIDRARDEVVAVPPDLPKRHDRHKVARLAELCRSERAKGRQVLVYAMATATRDVQPWLQEVLEGHGLRVAIMYGTKVNPRARRTWVANQVKKGVDVLICNPVLVQTGLDLFDFPTIIWFQCGYSLFTLRQASRRSWRIGQRKPVRVVFMAYSDTLQETALQLMGSKLEAAMGLEGRFSEEGLRALSDVEDMTMALAKALVKGLDGTDSAEALWRRVAPVVERPAGDEEGAAQAHQTVVAIEAQAFFRRKKGRNDGDDTQQLAFVL